MKILFVIESLGNGGAERVLITLITKLKQQGLQVELAMLFDSDQLVNELEQQKVPIHRLNLSHRWNYFAAVRGLKKILQEGRFDIVHAHLFFSHFYTGWLKRRYFPNLKTCVTLHNMAYEADPARNFVKKIRKRLDKLALQSFNKKIAVSNAVKSHFERELNLRNIHVVYNAFPVSEIINKRNPAIPPAFAAFKWNIVIPGRLVKEKGHIHFFNAVKLLAQKSYISDIAFYIVGDGPLKEQVHELITLSGNKNIFATGNLPQKELFQYLQHARLVVIPSVSEGFPMIVGEAMILGKAVLSTNVGGIPDLIDNGINGIMVSAGSGELLADKIDYLVRNPEAIASLEKEAFNKAKQFDVNIVAEQLLKIYKSL